MELSHAGQPHDGVRCGENPFSPSVGLRPTQSAACYRFGSKRLQSSGVALLGRDSEMAAGQGNELCYRECVESRVTADTESAWLCDKKRGHGVGADGFTLAVVLYRQVKRKPHLDEVEFRGPVRNS